MKRNPTPSPKSVSAIAALLVGQGLACGLAPGARAESGEHDRGESAVAPAPVRLENVIVTDDRAEAGISSPKFTESLVDTPQTITVIPPEVYEAQGATSLSDVLRNTPGITFFAGEGGSANRTGGDSFYLRGFDTSNSIFVDGVRDEGAAVHDVFDIEQVEVFKGPSAENGRGGTAGYINLETKLPTMKAAGDLLVSQEFSVQGSRVSDRVALDVDQP